jgi:hypothetical protein
VPWCAGVAALTPQRPLQRQIPSLSINQRAVNLLHAELRAPGERANAQPKNWRVLHKVRSSPSHASELVAAVQTLILPG